MKIKKVFVVSLVLCAFLAVCVGLGVYFFGFPNVSETPNHVELVKVDGKYQISTDFSSRYTYKFKIEKLLGTQFITFKEVLSKQNYVEIGSSEDFDVGESYRFSACYANENDSYGKYCKPYIWNISGQFEKQIDYHTVTFENETLSWDEIEGAEVYTYVVLNGAQEVLRETQSERSFSCSELGLGQYKVFINAGVRDPLVLSSEFGEGFSFKIERANVIEKVERDGKKVKVTCTQEVDNFKIFVDEQLKITLPAGELEEGVYTIDLSSLEIDFDTQKVEICSAPFGNYVKESAKVEIR